MALWVNEYERHTERKRDSMVCCICRRVCRVEAAKRFRTYFHNLPAYFKALMQYCSSVFCCCLLLRSTIFCLIDIHVQSVCLANLLVFRPSQLSYFMSMCQWAYFVQSFVLSASPQLVKKPCRNAAGHLYKLKAFTAPWGVRLCKLLRLEQCKLPSGFPVVKLLSLLCCSRRMPLYVFNSTQITCTPASWKDLVRWPSLIPLHWLKKWFISAISIAYDPAGNLFIVHPAHRAAIWSGLINVLVFLISIWMRNYLTNSLLHYFQAYTSVF